MAKVKLRFEVKKEVDIHANGYRLELRSNTPQSKISEFYDKFKELQPKLVESLLTVHEETKEEK